MFAGCLDRCSNTALLEKEEIVDRQRFPLKISARFLVFSYVKYFANDPTCLP
jgi:hypothetical protein